MELFENRNYAFTGEAKIIDGVLLHRIIATEGNKAVSRHSWRVGAKTHKLTA